MQIDFHHGTTYVLARLAGFNADDANIIASSAQYVDDSIHEGELFFTNRAAYSFMASAHRMLDYRNYKELSNHTSWIPFHFLPGNTVKSPEHDRVPDFVQKLITTPNSQISQMMVADVFEKKDHKFALYYLGVVMHVYADTWAHQGFCGIDHEVNKVKKILDWNDNENEFRTKKIKKYFKKWWRIGPLDKFLSWLLGELDPLGHGPALALPDYPFLKWKYINYFDEVVERDNTEIFMDACKHLYVKLYEYKHGSSPDHLPNSDFEKIKHLFATTAMDEGEDRHRVWLSNISTGYFSFGAESVDYLFDLFRIVPGLGDLNEKDLCIEQDCLVFTEEFMTSHWKNIQDAIFHHQVHVLHEVLPHFNLSVA